MHYQFDGLLQKLGLYRQRLPEDIGRVVFVCQGNICRSALAEAIFKQHCDVDAVSLGLDTTSGKPANPRLMKVAKEKANMDLSAHRTTSLQDYEHRPTDLFVCMEIRQIRQLRKLGYTNPCALLGAFGDNQMCRINDPYSANDYFMEKTVENIAYHATQLAKALKV
ncbi:arsenate-mycothiol transferase ArsC [Marinobacter fonticola]|uniref:arsenate-mycothiol transferase ArsC n=1 Tax=Marinobacter fonticola TaxID=2603215 RepID=UPI00143DB2D9|nr:hypothetical protein [Marinobacter fonticola]